MKVTVVIPFRGNPEILAWTIQGYFEQQLLPDVELLIQVGADGCEPPTLPSPANPRIKLSVRKLPRSGVAQSKNLLVAGLEFTSDDMLIFGNADTRPQPDCVIRHVARLRSLPPRSMVLGAAPFEETTTVFDGIKAATPAIFFYSLMTPNAWFDYRHAWPLNLSMWHSDFAAIGGYSDKLVPYGYEDLDLGHRLMGSTGKQVYYDPSAIVIHRHPMTLDQYLDREEMLGLMAPVLHKVNPQVFRGLNGTDDIRKLTREIKVWLAMDRAMHRFIYSRLQEWVDLPIAAAGEGIERQRLLNTLYQLHIPLKRLAFRLGFLRGLELASHRRWLDRAPASLWKAYTHA